MLTVMLLWLKSKYVAERAVIVLTEMMLPVLEHKPFGVRPSCWFDCMPLLDRHELQTSVRERAGYFPSRMVSHLLVWILPVRGLWRRPVLCNPVRRKLSSNRNKWRGRQVARLGAYWLFPLELRIKVASVVSLSRRRSK